MGATTRQKLFLLGAAVAYVALCVFCAIQLGRFGIGLPWFALFGPPALLVAWGKLPIWIFVVGTGLVAALVFGVSRTKSLPLQLACGFLLLVVWLAFGFLPYVLVMAMPHYH